MLIGPIGIVEGLLLFWVPITGYLQLPGKARLAPWCPRFAWASNCERRCCNSKSWFDFWRAAISCSTGSEGWVLLLILRTNWDKIFLSCEIKLFYLTFFSLKKLVWDKIFLSHEIKTFYLTFSLSKSSEMHVAHQRQDKWMVWVFFRKNLPP